MSSKPASIPCECGAEAVSVISVNENPICVRFAPYRFDKSKNVMSNGRGFGLSDQEHHNRYRRKFDGMKKAAAAARRSGSKSKTGVEWLGSMPGEMADSIGCHEGDPEAVTKDPVTFLKKTGLYTGHD